MKMKGKRIKWREQFVTGKEPLKWMSAEKRKLVTTKTEAHSGKNKNKNM